MASTEQTRKLEDDLALCALWRMIPFTNTATVDVLEYWLSEVQRLQAQLSRVRAAAQAVVSRERASVGDCDHKRYTCEEVGCIGHEIKLLEEALKSLPASKE